MSPEHGADRPTETTDRQTDSNDPQAETAAQPTDRPAARMRDVSHTNPLTGESFQDAYLRGPTVADGPEGRSPESVPNPSPRDGEEPRDAGDDDTGSTAVDGTMRDVDHTPPTDGTDANRVWARGGDVHR